MPELLHFLQRAQCLGHVYGRKEYGVSEINWWKGRIVGDVMAVIRRE